MESQHLAETILSIQDLNVKIGSSHILKNFDFQISKKEIHALVGESGSGKSTFASTVLGLLNEEASVTWKKFNIFSQDVPNGDFSPWKNWRGKRISLIPQTAAIGLHPFLSIGSQILEYFSLIQPEFANPETGIRLLKEFGLSDPVAAWEARPHQLSGGERQRILILLSVYSGAELILADEPTSALDPITGKSILDLLKSRVKDLGAGLLFISHDLSSARELADTITVMRSGERLETLKSKNGSFEPHLEYSRKLFTLDENSA
ncbi:ABC transporter ATP-binding protein [Leptospira selangorensis]|uniref:ABC transporter ATP-binding protein n=1 Tax=Leptospira selangorensis TaxID=2484982 RepID=A0A5F2C3H7_9LEPT|nr:ATP-binding cassette domain-containing protein [Leptospira selangorensis]TGM11341.1 ABC transporter ATP-binding protein [Leptospira selangorensis]TGM22907.1 ABC transporter ATP-binding protein [Leptospira selangorensis]